jgi:phenylacetate-CoA ligase
MTDEAEERGPNDDALYRAQIAGLFGRSLFYAEKFRAAGFASAADAGGLDRIAALPFTTKDRHRRGGPRASF